MAKVPQIDKLQQQSQLAAARRNDEPTPIPELRKFLQPSPALLEDAELALNNLAHQELLLVKETENLFKRQVDYIKQIDNLRDHIPNMEQINGNTKRLGSLVESAHVLVGDVCSKFRQIDLAKARLEDCLSKIGDILDLKTCRNGMAKAMQSNNYEEAAMHIKRFLSIDQKELQKTINIIIFGDQTSYWPLDKTNLLSNLDDDETPQPNTNQSNVQEVAQPSNRNQNSLDPRSINEALRELAEARVKLLNLCQENMARAIQEENATVIERFFKIFPMLNEHQDGLQRYSEYLKNKVVSQRVGEVLQSKEVNHADKLAALYESVAKLIDLHQPLVETYYGPGHLIVVIKVIQKECDRVSRKILEEFRNETKLQTVAKIVRSSSLQSINQNLTPKQTTNQLNLAPSKLDPRTVDKILNEISLIVSRSEVYLSFIVQRIKDDNQSKSENEAQKRLNQVELYNMIFYECELNHLAQEVGGIYVMLEQFYLNESSKKAIVMDQIDIDPSYSCLISSMLDDIFFIIKKCTKRAVSTKSNEVFCAIINHCVTLLESTFCQVLEERLKNQQYYTSFSAKNLDFSQAYNAIQSGRYLQSTNDQEKSNAQYFSALNNLEKACDYMKTLRGILDVDVKKLKPSILVLDSNHDNQLQKAVACLNEMTQLVSRFSSIINSSLYHLFNTSLRNRIKTEAKVVMDENPDLTAIVSSSTDELTSLTKSVIKTVDPCLERSLLPENYARLVSITNDFLSSTLKTLK
uniref:Conserved oligomeric Golgi complex subunit 4 n=1 Tax=Aceria tosichella TaxID=561515 RepID=A0A6G1SN13_9ACAR